MRAGCPTMTIVGDMSTDSAVGRRCCGVASCGRGEVPAHHGGCRPNLSSVAGGRILPGENLSHARISRMWRTRLCGRRGHAGSRFGAAVRSSTSASLPFLRAALSLVHDALGSNVDAEKSFSLGVLANGLEMGVGRPIVRVVARSAPLRGEERLPSCG